MLKWLIVLVSLLLLFVITAASFDHGSGAVAFLVRLPGKDKAGHFLLMGLLSLLVNIGLGAGVLRIKRTKVLKGSLAVYVAATIEEVSRLLLPYRVFDLGDLACSYLGIFLFGRLAASWIYRERNLAEI